MVQGMNWVVEKSESNKQNETFDSQIQFVPISVYSHTSSRHLRELAPNLAARLTGWLYMHREYRQISNNVVGGYEKNQSEPEMLSYF